MPWGGLGLPSRQKHSSPEVNSSWARTTLPRIPAYLQASLSLFPARYSRFRLHRRRDFPAVRLTSRAVGFAHFKATSRPGQWDIWRDALGLWEPMGNCWCSQSEYSAKYMEPSQLKPSSGQWHGLLRHFDGERRGYSGRNFLYESVELDPTTYGWTR